MCNRPAYTSNNTVRQIKSSMKSEAGLFWSVGNTPLKEADLQRCMLWTKEGLQYKQKKPPRKVGHVTVACKVGDDDACHYTDF